MTLRRKVAASAKRALEHRHATLGETKLRELGLDLFGNSLNVRKMRGGSGSLRQAASA
ncbi:hypothetical protein [Methylopila sp. Yamaguchi]|uniref:hypothetical protein n=1 Tax=Methylopila sp. Yamaguchi TaxID=1437817 RepID=UPI00135B8A45|nr:hypothetical protein [Methylopila sp. Yamaguchi]